MIRSLTLSLALFTFGCRAEQPDAPKDVTTPADEVIATETPSASLTVNFTTAWSATAPFTGTADEQVNLGAVLLTSDTEASLTVNTLAVSLWIDENSDGSYRLGAENGVEAGNFVRDCVLTDAVTNAVFAGPINAENGRLVFIDDFTVGGPTSTALNVRCTLVGSAPFGMTYGIAVDINHQSQEVIATEDGGVSLVAVTYGATNGTQSGLTLAPDVAVLLGYDSCSTTERRLHDLDGDGYGDPENYEMVGVCEPWETGLVQWIDGRDDCDDSNAEIHPDAEEVCDDGIDQDCDGDPADRFLIYFDRDNDGYGWDYSTATSSHCPTEDMPPQYVTNSDDCDDTDASIYPGHGC